MVAAGARGLGGKHAQDHSSQRRWRGVLPILVTLIRTGQDALPREVLCTLLRRLPPRYTTSHRGYPVPGGIHISHAFLAYAEAASSISSTWLSPAYAS
jgi:hypothetical protein